MTDPVAHSHAEADTGTGVPAGRLRVVAAAAAMVMSLLVTGQTYLTMLDHGHSIVRLLAWQIAYWGFWALLAQPVVNIGARLASTGDEPLWTRLASPVALGAALVAVHVPLSALVDTWVQPFAPMPTPPFGEGLLAQLGARLVIDVVVYGMLVAVGYGLSSYRRARRLKLRQSRLETELAHAHLEALRLEIQPHFLFNTLNSIAALIRARANDRALTMLLDLSDLLRATLDRGDAQLVTLAVELDLVRRYVTLQAVRVGDRLRVDYEIDQGCLECRVPSLIVQPLVENAFRHGLARRAGSCRMSIAAGLRDGELYVRITDDGTGLPTGFDLDRDAGIGLRNIRARLQQLYGGAARCTLTPGPGGGTVAELGLPVAAREQGASRLAAG